MRSVISKIVYAAVLPALVAAGIAIAQSGGSSDQKSSDVQRAPDPALLPPPPLLTGNLTYAEIHAQRNGDEVVVRIDRGKVKSVGSDSVTITENNGSDVTVPANEDTRVLLGPRRGVGKLSDLKEGQTVIAHREAGKAASVIAVPPRAGALPPGPPPPFGHRGRHRSGELPPAPPPFGHRGWHRSDELPGPPPLPDANP